MNFILDLFFTNYYLIKNKVKGVLNNPKNAPASCIFVLLCTYFMFYPLPDKYALFNLQNLVNNFGLDTTISMFGSMVSHANFSHYIGNMFIFCLVSPKIEERHGVIGLIKIGTLAGIMGAFGHSLADNWDSNLLGASGLIFGLLGAHVAEYRKTAMGYITGAILGVLVLKEYMQIGAPYVAHMAHVGGFFGGLIVALYLIVHKK